MSYYWSIKVQPTITVAKASPMSVSATGCIHHYDYWVWFLEWPYWRTYFLNGNQLPKQVISSSVARHVLREATGWTVLSRCSHGPCCCCLPLFNSIRRLYFCLCLLDLDFGAMVILLTIHICQEWIMHWLYNVSSCCLLYAFTFKCFNNPNWNL